MMIGGGQSYAYTQDSFIQNAVDQTDPPIDVFASIPLLDMYYIQSHSQQRHRGGLGILIPSFLVLSFRSFKSDEVAEIAH